MIIQSLSVEKVVTGSELVTYIGNPEAKPIKQHSSMRRLNSDEKRSGTVAGEGVTTMLHVKRRPLPRLCHMHRAARNNDQKMPRQRGGLA